MSDSSGTGFVALNDNMYFTCSSGLAAAKIQATQNINKTKDGFNYLVKDDTGCPAVGDFMCRWTVVLAAAVAAAGVVTGGAAFAALAVVAVAASMALCGGLMAPMRKWVGYSTSNAYGRKDAYSLTSKCQMLCPIGGVVTYAPGITSEWQALLYFGRNTGWAVLEGFVVGKFASGGFAAFAGKASPTLIKGLLNFAFLNVTARGIGVVDQVLIEGMLRNGKHISDTGEEALGGASMFEQPFINIFNRAKSGYYTGGYAKDADGNNIEEAHNGHGTGAAITDTYYALLSAVSMGLMVKASATHENIKKESIAAAKETIAKAMEGGKRFLFERTTTVYRTQGGELPNASQHRILIDENGNVSIKGNGMLYVTLDDAAHQIYFYEKRGGSAKNAEIASFRIPKSLADEIKNNGVPQKDGKAYPDKPQISDPTKSSGAYGLPKEYIQKLRQQAIPGSGKIQQPSIKKGVPYVLPIKHNNND